MRLLLLLLLLLLTCRRPIHGRVPVVSTAVYGTGRLPVRVHGPYTAENGDVRGGTRPCNVPCIRQCTGRIGPFTRPCTGRAHGRCTHPVYTTVYGPCARPSSNYWHLVRQFCCLHISGMLKLMAESFHARRSFLYSSCMNTAQLKDMYPALFCRSAIVQEFRLMEKERKWQRKKCC